MDLNRQELAELARFFAKRFPDARHRGDLAERAGLFYEETPGGDALQAWLELLSFAQSKGALARLADAAGRTNDNDENLQAVCELLAGRRPRRRGRPPAGLMVGAIAGVALIGAATWLLVGRGRPDGKISATTPTPPAASTPPPAVSTAHSQATTPPPAASSPAPKPAPEPTGAPTSSQPAVAPANVRGHCTLAKDGALIGYWYAGKTAPGSRGEVITMGYSVHVRVAYPDASNGYNARTPVRCVLRKGDRVKLSADPVLVPGDRYWVPLYSGDVQAD